MTTTQIRSTAAAFLTALSTPDVFGAWAAVPKDDKVAVGKFFAQTLGLAQAPTSDELTALEAAILELTGQTTPDVRAPQHVGFMVMMQQTAPKHVGMGYIQQDQPTPQHVGIGYVQQDQRTPQHVGVGFAQQNAPEIRAPQHVGFVFLMQQAATKLNADQHRAIAAGFLGALASPTVFQAWSAISKDDRSAVAAFIRDAIGLAESPTEGDLAAIETLVQEMLAAQTVEVRAPQTVGFLVMMQQMASEDVTISDADLRELLQLSQLTAGE